MNVAALDETYKIEHTKINTELIFESIFHSFCCILINHLLLFKTIIIAFINLGYRVRKGAGKEYIGIWSRSLMLYGW